MTLLEGTSILSREYYELLRSVANSDDRLLTIKGWGGAFSLAALVLGIRHKHWGVLTVAAISALSFWTLEGAIKGHQMRYFPRMQQIEMSCADKRGAPRDDSRWAQAPSLVPSAAPRAPTTVTSELDWQYWAR